MTYTIAAGTTLTVAGTLTLTDGNINTGTVAAQGAINQASTFDGNSGTLLINGAGGQTFTGPRRRRPAACPTLVINKPSGTLTLAGTIRTTHNWTYTAGTLDAGHVARRLRRHPTISGSHTLNDVDVQRRQHRLHRRRRARPLTVAGTLTLTDGNISDRHGRRPGRASARPRPSTATPAPCSSTGPAPRRSPAPPRRPPATCRRSSSTSPRARSPWPAHPHEPRLDLYRGDARPGHVQRRLRGRHDHGQSHPQRGRLPGHHDRRRGHDPDRRRHAQPDRRQPQHGHGRGRRPT